jgi:hypothetical protein
MSYVPITAAQSTAAQNSANADTQLALNQSKIGALGGQFDRSGDRGASQGSNLTAIASPQFAGTMNAVDPTGQGNFGKDLQETQQILQPESTIDKIMQAVSLGASIAPIAALTGGAAAGALGGGTLGTIGGGVVGGATAGAESGLLTQGTAGGAIGKGALAGGIAGGVGAAATPLVSGLGDQIYNVNPGWVSSDTADALAGGIVKGGIGASMGALSGGSNGALVGGIGGATAGAVSGETGNSQLGQVSGTIAGGLANKYLTTPPSAPAPIQAPAAVPAAQANTQQILPTLSGTATTTQGPTGNIGPYSGYQGSTAGLGYAPRQEANMSNVDWATYGQGPEQQFFQPASGG